MFGLWLVGWLVDWLIHRMVRRDSPGVTETSQETRQLCTQCACVCACDLKSLLEGTVFCKEAAYLHYKSRLNNSVRHKHKHQTFLHGHLRWMRMIKGWQKNTGVEERVDAYGWINVFKGSLIDQRCLINEWEMFSAYSDRWLHGWWIDGFWKVPWKSSLFKKRAVHSSHFGRTLLIPPPMTHSQWPKWTSCILQLPPAIQPRFAPRTMAQPVAPPPHLLSRSRQLCGNTELQRLPRGVLDVLQVWSARW